MGRTGNGRARKTSAAVGRVKKSAKSLPSSLLLGGLAPRLKKNQRLFEGIGVLNRGKAVEKVAFSKACLADFENEKLMCEENGKEEVLEEAAVKHVEAGGSANLMRPIMAPGESVVLKRSGQFTPLPEQRNPKIKMDLEELATKMREKMKWNCETCSVFLQTEAAVRNHKEQAKISFVGSRKMKFKTVSCVIVMERVFSGKLPFCTTKGNHTFLPHSRFGMNEQAHILLGHYLDSRLYKSNDINISEEDIQRRIAIEKS